METEEWRRIADWPEYEVSSLGRVRRVVGGKGTRAGRILKLTPYGKGYLRVGLSSGGSQKSCDVHRLVASAFLPKDATRTDVAHGDGNRANNRVSNLRWATPLENAADKHIHGTVPKGAACYNAKLTDAAVRAIRAAAGSASQKTIASRFGIHVMTVNKVINRRSWRHV